jgi:hypothetical protein
VSRGRSSFLAAVAVLLAILVWVAPRPGDRVRRTEPDVMPPGAAAQSRPATASATAPIRPRSFVEPDEAETRAATRAEGLTISVLSRSVWVQVVDVSGAPKQATVTFVLADGTKLIAVGRSAGSYEVERASARPARVEAKAGDEVASVAVGADQTQARIVLGR